MHCRHIGGVSVPSFPVIFKRFWNQFLTLKKYHHFSIVKHTQTSVRKISSKLLISVRIPIQMFFFKLSTVSSVQNVFSEIHGLYLTTLVNLFFKFLVWILYFELYERSLVSLYVKAILDVLDKRGVEGLNK